MSLARIIILSFLSIILVACSNTNSQAGAGARKSAGKAAVAALPKLDVKQIENILGIKGWKLEATHPASKLAQWSVVNDPNAKADAASFFDDLVIERRQRR